MKQVHSFDVYSLGFVIELLSSDDENTPGFEANRLVLLLE